MGKVKGFKDYDRIDEKYIPVRKRLKNYKEFTISPKNKELKSQAARCMDCGVPFCHSGCPLGNLIPDFNDLVYNNKWKEALDVLHSTNNFPEFTGRICPAPCESACTLNLEDNPVTIKNIEKTIIDKGYQKGWVKPLINKNKTNKKIAIVGSGPAGMACAQQLARSGHSVKVYEKNDRIGGLLRYGIPNFKMEKKYINKRIAQMELEGVSFICNTEIGKDISFNQLNKDFDAIVFAGGAERPRDLEIPGRKLKGIHFAMDFLTQQNKRCEGDNFVGKNEILASNKDVVVIGGGDTGSDCIGTSNRQGAKSVTQLEIMEKPPAKENKLMTWPHWPLKLRTSSSQEEGVQRSWSVATKKFEGKAGNVSKLLLQKINWEKDSLGRMAMKESDENPIELKADLVLLAMGFVSPENDDLFLQSKVKLNSRGNVEANEIDYSTNKRKVFTAGDMRRGQSLVVWAIREGRQAAEAVNRFLLSGKKVSI